MPKTSPALAQPPTSARSRVGTGRALFLTGVDGRGLVARRFREVLASLLEGLPRSPREADIQIARRAASLIVWSESIEAQQVAGQPVDIAEFTTAANTLRRLLAALGATTEQPDQLATNMGPHKLVIEYVEATGEVVRTENTEYGNASR